jgi:hypothetical protein
MRVLATFATRDIADSMKDMLTQHGFYESDMVVLANRVATEPPEDAEIEVGKERGEGFAGFEEKIGKAVNDLLGKHEILEGTGSEGDPNGGALLTVEVTRQEDADRAIDLLKLHQAADIEVTSTE